MGNTITYKKIFEVWKTENFFQKSQLICLLRKAIFKVCPIFNFGAEKNQRKFSTKKHISHA